MKIPKEALERDQSRRAGSSACERQSEVVGSGWPSGQASSEYSDVLLIIELTIQYTPGLYYWLPTDLDYGCGRDRHSANSRSRTRR